MAPTTALSPALPAQIANLDEEIDTLASAFDAGADPDHRARLIDQICRLSLPLADAIAMRYRNRGIETDDLKQVARTALVKAVIRYRRGAGCGFAAYAAPTISGEVKRAFRDYAWSVRPPRRLQELRAAVSSQEDSLRQLLGREASVAEVAAALDVPEDDVVQAKLSSDAFHAVSLDLPTPTGGTLGSVRLVCSAPFESVEVRDALRRAMSILTERQRLVLSLRYVDELTQREIGEQIGVSQMQVSRILRATLVALRAELGRDGSGATWPADGSDATWPAA